MILGEEKKKKKKSKSQNLRVEIFCICFARNCSYLETCFGLSIGRFRENTVCSFTHKWVVSFFFSLKIMSHTYFICQISFSQIPQPLPSGPSFTLFPTLFLPLFLPDTPFRQSRSKIKGQQHMPAMFQYPQGGHDVKLGEK